MKSAKLCALSAHLPYVPPALRALVPQVLLALSALVPHVPRALRAHVSRAQHARVPHVSPNLSILLSQIPFDFCSVCLRASHALGLAYPCASRASRSTCSCVSRALVPYVSLLPCALRVCVCVLVLVFPCLTWLFLSLFSTLELLWEIYYS